MAAIVSNQLRSITAALLTVGALLVLAVGVGGMLVCIIPAAAAVIVVLGAMGHAGVPLGIATSMFASLTVGVGADFGIHLLHQYRVERAAGRSSAEAVAATIDKVGTAVGWNCLVLAAGFLVLTVSALRPNHSLGVLLASAMVVSYGGAIMLSPCLLRALATWLVASSLVVFLGGDAVADRSAFGKCAVPGGECGLWDRGGSGSRGVDGGRSRLGSVVVRSSHASRSGRSTANSTRCTPTSRASPTRRRSGASRTATPRSRIFSTSSPRRDASRAPRC